MNIIPVINTTNNHILSCAVKRVVDLPLATFVQLAQTRSTENIDWNDVLK